MANEYDTYYQTANLFGDPYTELLDFYSTFQDKGKLLDLGCGQGRNAIALGRLGFDVTGIDNSAVGIAQLNSTAQQEKLSVQGIIGDIFEDQNFGEYDFILLDSMFHFGKQERTNEIALLERVFKHSKVSTFITVCIQDTGKKVSILKAILDSIENLEIVDETELEYKFEDQESLHFSITPYKMITVRKQG